MNENELLGGFSAVFEELGSNASPSALSIDEDNDDGVTIVGAASSDEPEEDGNTDLITEENKADEMPDDPADNPDDSGSEAQPSEEDKQESEIARSLFGALSEKLDWLGEIEDEPKSIEDLVEKIKSTVEQKAKPSYYSEDIAALDKYVKEGGTIESFINAGGNLIDYDSLDVEDIEIQRELVREYLEEKGFSEAQISRKLEKYEDADLLEDEAKDAIEELKIIKEERNKALLVEQEKMRKQAEIAQQKFYESVVSDIESMTHIGEIEIPKKDRKELLRYIFEVEPDGKTRYQKDYMKSNEGLIKSAYMQMKGNELIKSAVRSGQSSAVQKLRETLKSSGAGSSKSPVSTGSAAPVWSLVSKQLIK